MGDFADYGSEADYQEAHMGDMADYYKEQEIVFGELWPDTEMFEPDPPRITRASKWTTRDGQKIAIRDLEDSHLRNILMMHERHRLRLPIAWFIALNREWDRRRR